MRRRYHTKIRRTKTKRRRTTFVGKKRTNKTLSRKGYGNSRGGWRL